MTTGEPGARAVAGQPSRTGAGAAGTPAERRRRTAALRRQLAAQLVFEFALPLGSYYVLRAFGADQWLSMVIGGVLVLPWIAWGLLRRGRVEMVAVFTLSVVVLGTLLSMVTGDARTLMIRDSWFTAAVALWVLASVLTRRPFIMAASRGIVIAKVGEEGWAGWEARWDEDPRFRHHLRLVTAVWGAGLLLDAVLRVVLVYTIPLDAVPLTTTVLLVVLIVGLSVFNNWYYTRHGLKL